MDFVRTQFRVGRVFVEGPTMGTIVNSTWTPGDQPLVHSR